MVAVKTVFALRCLPNEKDKTKQREKQRGRSAALALWCLIRFGGKELSVGFRWFWCISAHFGGFRLARDPSPGPKLFLAGTFGGIWWHMAPSAVQAPSKEPLASALVLFGLYNASFRGPLFSNVEPHSTMSRGKRRGNTSHSQIQARSLFATSSQSRRGFFCLLCTRNTAKAVHTRTT